MPKVTMTRQALVKYLEAAFEASREEEDLLIDEVETAKGRPFLAQCFRRARFAGEGHVAVLQRVAWDVPAMIPEGFTVDLELEEAALEGK